MAGAPARLTEGGGFGHGSAPPISSCAGAAGARASPLRWWRALTGIVGAGCRAWPSALPKLGPCRTFAAPLAPRSQFPPARSPQPRSGVQTGDVRRPRGHQAGGAHALRDFAALQRALVRDRWWPCATAYSAQCPGICRREPPPWRPEEGTLGSLPGPCRLRPAGPRHGKGPAAGGRPDAPESGRTQGRGGGGCVGPQGYPGSAAAKAAGRKPGCVRGRHGDAACVRSALRAPAVLP